MEIIVTSYMIQIGLFYIFPRKIKYVICKVFVLNFVINIVGSLLVKEIFGEAYGIGAANMVASGMVWLHIFLYGWWHKVYVDWKYGFIPNPKSRKDGLTDKQIEEAIQKVRNERIKTKENSIE